MRRWIRGPEGRGRRGRGLETRLRDMLGDRDDARRALDDATRAAAALPAEGWSSRVAPGSGDVSPLGPIEIFLVAVLDQLHARTSPSDIGMECAARPALEHVRATARAASTAIAAIEAPLLLLARRLADVLDDEAETLESGERGRIEGGFARSRSARTHDAAGVARDAHRDRRERRRRSGLRRLVRRRLPLWPGRRCGVPAPLGRSDRTAHRRGDRAGPWRAGGPAPHWQTRRWSIRSPWPKCAPARRGWRNGPRRCGSPRRSTMRPTPGVLIVNDIERDDSRQVGAAMRELFLAAGGGGIGLFTAIRRLKAVHERIAGPLADKGVALYAQHVDPLDVGALVDIFRAEIDSCLLGTDAVRDGVDVPGRVSATSGVRSRALAAPGYPAQGAARPVRRQGLRRRGRARSDRPGVRPPHPPRRRQRRVRPAGRRPRPPDSSQAFRKVWRSRASVWSRPSR